MGDRHTAPTRGIVYAGVGGGPAPQPAPWPCSLTPNYTGKEAMLGPDTAQIDTQMSFLRLVTEWSLSGRKTGWNFPEGLLRGFQRFLN